MRITYGLISFFAQANEFNKTAVLLEICERDPDFLLHCVEAVIIPAWKKEVERLLREKKKIDAIRLWRAETEMHLKDAKDAVESFQRKLGL